VAQGFAAVKGLRHQSEESASRVVAGQMVMSTCHVYVSSTWLDLRPERQAVERAVQRMRETKFIGMEYFGARDESTSRTSVAELDDANVYVGIFAGRYGSGIVEQEYRRARELGKRCLIYFKDGTHTSAESPDETGAAHERLCALKNELAGRHTIGHFATPDDLAAQLTADLHRLLFDEFTLRGDRTTREAFDEALRNYFDNEYDRSLRDYLNAVRQFSDSSYRSLPFPDGKTLTDVYVDLHARSESVGQAGTIREVLSHGAPESGIGISIVGDAGAGKSTLIRHIARHAWDHPEAVGLRTRHLPIVVRAPAIALARGIALEERLWSAIGEGRDIMMDVPPPRGWFEAWPSRMAAPWLLLVDGFDEVPDNRRQEIMAWIRDVLRRNFLLVLTSRPDSALKKGPFAGLFQSFSLEPLTNDQQSQLSRQWLGTATGTFRDELQRLRAADVAGTPLLVTVAAIVFQRDGRLPTTRAALYERFVDVWWREALERGIRDELGPDLSDVARSGLQHVAWHMLNEPEQRSRSALAESLRAFFASVPGQLSYVTTQRMDHFLEVMGRRSGVLQSTRTDCDWLHRSFGEFLAGEFLASNAADSPAALAACARWHEHSWRPVVLFALGLWSERGHDMTPLLERVIDDATSGRTVATFADPPPWSTRLPEMSVVFAARAIGEGAVVERAFRDRLLSEMFPNAKEYAGQSLGERMLSHVVMDHTVQVLAAFANDPDVAGRLDALARDFVEIVHRWRQRGAGGPVALRDLAALRRFDALLSLARDSSLHPYCRYCACRELAGHDFSAIAVPMIVELLRMPAFEPWIEYALRTLRKRGDPGQLVAIARDADWPIAVRSQVPGVLMEAKLTRETLELAQDQGVSPAVRLRAAELAHVAGHDDDAAQVIVALSDAFLRDHPGDIAALVRRASLHLELHRHQDVIADCTTILEDNPDHVEALTLRGCALMAMDRDREAIVDFDRAEPLLATDEDRWLCLTRRAISCACIDGRARAVADFDAAAQMTVGPELGQRYTWYRPWYGISLAAAARYDEAVTMLNRAVEGDPASAWPIAARGATFLLLDRLDEAISDFSRALALQPDFVWARRRRAACYSRSDRLTDAIADLTEALVQAPDDAALTVRRLLLCLAAHDDRAALAGIEAFSNTFVRHHTEPPDVIEAARALETAADAEAAAAARERLIICLSGYDRRDDVLSLTQ